jgi:hypothetical protein
MLLTVNSELDGRWENTVKGVEKGKVVLVHSMKTYRGSGDIPPLILHIGTNWE